MGGKTKRERKTKKKGKGFFFVFFLCSVLVQRKDIFWAPLGTIGLRKEQKKSVLLLTKRWHRRQIKSWLGIDMGAARFFFSCPHFESMFVDSRFFLSFFVSYVFPHLHTTSLSFLTTFSFFKVNSNKQGVFCFFLTVCFFSTLQNVATKTQQKEVRGKEKTSKKRNGIVFFLQKKKRN